MMPDDAGNPWVVYDRMDPDAAPCRHKDEVEAAQHHPGQAITVQYRPRKKDKALNRKV
jgi:hypothetical protein